MPSAVALAVLTPSPIREGGRLPSRADAPQAVSGKPMSAASAQVKTQFQSSEAPLLAASPAIFWSSPVGLRLTKEAAYAWGPSPGTQPPQAAHATVPQPSQSTTPLIRVSHAIPAFSPQQFGTPLNADASPRDWFGLPRASVAARTM